MIRFGNTDKMYYADNNGSIIDKSKMLKITTVDELKAFRDDVNSGNTYENWYVYLANNITLDINEEWKPIGLYPMENTSPADESNKPFKGIFDGCGYEINGIYINTTDKVKGLFGLVLGGKISNLGIGENCNITGNLSVGAMAGYLYKGTIAINCYNKSNLTGGSYSGALFGQAYDNCNIENCYNIGNFTMTSDNIENCGGILGNINNCSIRKCYNEGTIGNVENTISQIGGIVGNAELGSSIDECYNKGIINGNTKIGGIVGQMIMNSSIQNCYNAVNITGETEIGGIVGKTANKIYNCYNIGNIVGTTKVGGIVGELGVSSTYNTIGIMKNSYSLKNSCEDICGYVVEGVTIEKSSIQTEAEMKLLVLALGAAFKKDTNNINQGYPILSWQ